MAEQSYKEFARRLFSAVQADFAGLQGRISEDPIPQIQLELLFDVQPDLIFSVAAMLQGDELCLSVGEHSFGEWFPCTDAGVVEQYRRCLIGVLSGEIRLIEFSRNGRVFKAQLQKCSSGTWRSTATWMRLRWPSLRSAEIHVRRNRPSRLRSAGELDRGLLADLRDDAGDSQVTVEAFAALRREAKRTDLPWLKSLLKDKSALVREAAAAPIADLDGLSALRDLLAAFQRGVDEGHDQDGFAALLIDMVSEDSLEAAQYLKTLIRDDDRVVRELALWLTGHLRR